MNAPAGRVDTRVVVKGASLALVSVLACALFVSTATANATVYGFSDLEGTFAACSTNTTPCNQTTHGYSTDPAFATLAGGDSRHPLRMVRLFVPYDAVSTSDSTGACRASNPWMYGYTDRVGRAYPARFAWSQLANSLLEAAANGYTPLVTIGGYTTHTAVASYSGSSAAGDPGEPDPTTVTGSQAYSCGVQGLVRTLAGSLPAAARPHYWEAWNEPNGGCTYLNKNCDSATCARLDETYPCGATGADDTSCSDANDAGAARAACLAVAATSAIRGVTGHTTDTVIDGAFSWPSTDYLTPYYNLLKAQNSLSTTWSVHDYGDVTASGWLGTSQTAQLANFDSALSSRGCAGCEIWITEAAINLLDDDTTYNGQNVSCPLGHTLGACVNGEASAQLAGTRGFFNLATVGPLPVTHLFWYEWHAPASGGWDSGMVDTAGVARGSYCVWVGLPSTVCAGSPWARGAPGLASSAPGLWDPQSPNGIPSASPDKPLGVAGTS